MPATRDNDAQDPPRSKLQQMWERFSVSIVFVLFVLLRAGDRVLLKRVQNSLKDPTYNLMLMNLIWPLSIAVLSAIMLLGYIAIMRKCGNTSYTWRFFLPGNAAASRLGPVPLYQLALLQLGDQLNAALSAPPTPFISQTMNSVMTNTAVIGTAVLAWLCLRSRFRQVHVIGCMVIVLSVVVGLSNKLAENDCSTRGIEQKLCLSEYKSVDGQMYALTTPAMMTWYGMFLFSQFPIAGSNVYKQFVLQGKDVDVAYATWWANIFQVVWGWLCALLIWIPFPESHPVRPQGTFQALTDTMSCLFGGMPHGQRDVSCAENSVPAIAWFALYLLFNLSFNVLYLWLTKKMSATWAQVATVLCLDLTNVFGQWSVLAGGGAQAMTLFDWLGTALASIGLWTYSLESETRENDKALENCSAGSERREGDEALENCSVSPMSHPVSNLAVESFSRESSSGIGKTPLLLP